MSPRKALLRIPLLHWWQALRAGWLVLPISIAATIAAWHYSNLHIAQQAQDRFAFRVTQVSEAVRDRMHDYEQVLRGGVGLFHANANQHTEISRAQWHTYVENAQIAKHYPGIQIMAAAFPVKAAEMRTHLEKVRAEGFPDYTVHPEKPARELYYSLLYIEPFSGRNLRAFGFDMYQNPTRRAAMDRAIDQGLPTVSGMIKLIQDSGQNNPEYGFIFCLPAYKAPQQAKTLETRRASLRALICAAFRATDLMRGIVGNSAKDLELEIYDDGKFLPQHRLYSSAALGELPQAELESWREIEVGGRKWLLRIQGNPIFMASLDSMQSKIIAIAGILLNLALFAALASMAGRERHAQKIAQEMMRDLYDKEVNFGRIIASTSEAIISKRLDGCITSWNPAAEKMFGYTSREALQHPITLILDEAQYAAEEELLSKIQKGEGIDHFETRHRRKDGSMLDVAVSLSLQYDVEGKLVGATRIMRDISERKQAEAKLAALQYRMRQWVEELPIGLFVVDMEGKPHYTNRRAGELLGRGTMPEVPPEELAQIYQVYYEDSDQLYPVERLPVMRALAGEACTVDDLEIHMDGQRRKLQVWGQPVFNAEGQVEYGVAAFEDITERKQVLALQAQYVDIIAFSNDPIISINLDCLLTSWNPAAERMFGYTMAEAVGQSALMLVPAERRAEEPMLMERLLRGEYISHMETVRMRKDGSLLDVAVNLSPLRNHAGQVVGASAILSDISQRKQVERLKSEFVSTVSHELRTPLTSIRGSIGLIMGGAVGQIPERAASLLTIAANNCERLVRLINDILDIEKLESGKFHLNLQRHNLCTLLQQVVQSNQAYATQLGVQLVVEESPEAIWACCDADRITQVLTNLLSNAAKFSPRGANVEISLSRTARGEARIAVQDHGQGIPHTFRPRIFQKFAQADSSDTRQIQRGGTGLGLSIAKAIIEQHGGFIGFESEEGSGACFYFLLKEDKTIN